MNRYYRRIRYLMGSSIEVTVYGEKEVCSKGLDAAFLELARVERLLSVYRLESELMRINTLSNRGGLRVAPELLEIIFKSVDYAERSGGAFDPTCAPLIHLWGFGPTGERTMVPKKEEIELLRRRVGFQHLRIDRQTGQIHLLQEGMELNLGGVGKGYGIDQAVQKLKAAGLTRALVSCGSTIYGLGIPPGEEGWRIKIRHPRFDGEEIGSVFLRDQALSTSGDYEKFFVFEGRRFSHLIDPRTGYPAEGVASVSVVAQTATEADALSTAAFVLGVEEGMRFLEGFTDVEGLIVEEDSGGRLLSHPTSGWERLLIQQNLSRRRFLALASIILAGLLLPARAQAVVVYLTEEEALRKMMPDADRFDTEEIHLTSDQLSKAQQLAGKMFKENYFRFSIGRKEKEAVGYAMMLEVVGKERPITFLIGIEPNGLIKGVEVLTYRESRGAEIRYPRFMAQFLKKKIDDPLSLGQDIQPISGATLSSRAAAYAVRKALSVFEVVYKKKEGAG